MYRLAAIRAVHRRNLLLIRREPTLIAQTMLLPTAILLLVAFIFGGGGDRWPVAVVDGSNSDASRGVIGALERAESQITPYFSVRRVSLDEARERIAAGRLHLAVHIPPDYETSQRFETFTYNINTDAMKNVRLRLDHVLATELGASRIDAVVAPEQPHQPWRSAYMGGSSVMLAVLLGTTLVAANLMVFDRERKTRSPMLLTPVGSELAGLGHVVTAVIVALGASVVPLGISLAVFNLKVSPGTLVTAYLFLLPAMVGLAGVGVLVGQTLGSFRNVQPVVVMACLVTFFGGGGFVTTSMLHPILQSSAELWLPSRLFTWVNPVLHGFGSFTASQIAAFTAAGAAGPLLAVWAYRRELRQSPGQAMV